ncbi:hypothetical protein LI142_13545 [Eubacterium limosum]|uniref:hypothetical protein n=1 Tax=Eubacterium limosum TaxID=1736 RepID=UPI001D08B666|nr:hypothetical protein [Eubacterium limosum]MCB6570523.1 hypothetical protein [Eubacterium limosum]
MNHLRTVESKVLEILKEDERTRYDDMLLILRYYNRFGYLRAGDMPFEDVVMNYKGLGLPCFESIRRARQRVQSCFPEYSRNPMTVNDGGVCIVINIS